MVGSSAEVEGSMPRKMKVLLDSIFDEVCDNEVLVVLGAGGSRKFMLINVLTKRISRESLDDAITLNGKPLGEILHKAISTFVMQDDLFFLM